MRSQFVTSRLGGARYYPLAFTENLLNTVEDAPLSTGANISRIPMITLLSLSILLKYGTYQANRYVFGCRIALCLLFK